MTTPSKASARMTPTDAPDPTPAVSDCPTCGQGPTSAVHLVDCRTEPTPAVERVERALVEAWHGTIGRAFHPTRIRETRAALAAALETECHEAVADEDGEEQPCNAYAVAYREEVVGDAVLGVYPVCEEHARPPLVPLTTAILGGVTA